MERYAAMLRGVMPTLVKMPALKSAFEAAGFTDVRTVLGSGNVVFSVPGPALRADGRAATERALERKAEAAMKKELGRVFVPFVRSVEDLRAVLAKDPYAAFRLPPNAKRVVTFLHEAPRKVSLPIEKSGARILRVIDREVFGAYVPNPEVGPVFMTLIQKTFGEDVTTRTWDTVSKLVK